MLRFPAPALLLVTTLAFAVSSCATLFPPRTGLLPVKPSAEPAWSDDGDRQAFDEAIGQSIRFYSQLPPETEFVYGGLRYSPEELIRSLELFRSLPADPAQRRDRLARDFLVFESVAPGGNNLFTGYYEPEIDGSHAPAAGLDAPLLGRPLDLIEVRLERFGKDLPHKRIMGRVQGQELLPYYDRADIQDRQALDGQTRVIAYVNEFDLFFLQIQGSGVIRFSDGETLQVGYDGANGHPYRSIGAELIRRNALTREQVTLQSIRDWIRDHPDEARTLLFTNPSYVFFRETPEGPLGNIQVRLTPGRSLAADDTILPKGGLAYVETELPDPALSPENSAARTTPLRRFFLIQDTGGAIRGHGRADLFWGRGAEAEWRAGHLKHGGRLFLLVARKEALQSTAASN
jgi:membrane-bound lytic murein transglycosylase A